MPGAGDVITGRGFLWPMCCGLRLSKASTSMQRSFCILLMCLLIAVAFSLPAAAEEPGAVVVEIRVLAVDELPFESNTDSYTPVSDEIRLEGARLLIGPRASRAIRWLRSDPSLEVEEALARIDQIGAVIIEQVEYAGSGRRGFERRILISKSLPDFPSRKKPSKVAVGVWDADASLNDILPWPSAVEWSVTKEDHLNIMVAAEEHHSLGPGEKLALPEVSFTIPVQFETFAPVMKGDTEAARRLKTMTHKLGGVRFSSAVTIVFHGRLPIEELR